MRPWTAGQKRFSLRLLQIAQAKIRELQFHYFMQNRIESHSRSQRVMWRFTIMPADELHRQNGFLYFLYMAAGPHSPCKNFRVPHFSRSLREVGLCTDSPLSLELTNHSPAPVLILRITAEAASAAAIYFFRAAAAGGDEVQIAAAIGRLQNFGQRGIVRTDPCPV